MTVDQSKAVMVAALQIAMTPPQRPTATARSAYVPWDMIEALRRAFDDAGVQWRLTK